MQFLHDGSGGRWKPAGSRATRLGEHDGSGGRWKPAGSRATRLGEHDGSGGTLKPAGSRATRLGEHDGSGGTETPAGSRATRLGEHAALHRHHSRHHLHQAVGRSPAASQSLRIIPCRITVTVMEEAVEACIFSLHALGVVANVRSHSNRNCF